MTFIQSSGVVGAGGQGTIDFTNIPATFTHLQLRIFARTTSANWVTARFNNDSGSNYRDHFLYGQGTTAISSTNGQTSLAYLGPYLGATTANTFGVAIVDILDYANTNKNKVTRTLWGYENNNGGGDQVWFQSVLWMSTAAINQITLSLTTFAQGSRADLYGIGVSTQTGA